MRKRTKIIIGLIALLISVADCDVILRAMIGDPLPALLRNLEAKGGVWDGCPVRTPSETQIQDDRWSAASPDLGLRLRSSYPAGTREELLINDLKAQGFGEFQTCKFDTSIKKAGFQQKTGLTPAQAEIYWKIDNAGHIEWTKGFIFYGSL